MNAFLSIPSRLKQKKKQGKQKIKNCNRVLEVDREVVETGPVQGAWREKMLVPGQHLFVSVKGGGHGCMDGGSNGCYCSGS